MNPRMPGSRLEVALIGAGAVGLSLAAALCKAGVDVTICGARSYFETIIITEDGEQKSFKVKHISSPCDLGPCHMAILAVKTHQTKAVAEWLTHFNKSNALILAAQNGLGHLQRISKFAPKATILPAIIYLNVERSAAGHVTLRRVTDCDICVPENKMGNPLVSSLRTGGMRVKQVADMTTIIWTKLLSNIVANPITALTGRRADVMRDPLVEDTARLIMTEALKVGVAEGAKLDRETIEEAMTWLKSVPPGSTTSMRQDRIAGRPLEYEALTGAIIEAADRHGIDVPSNRLVFSLLQAIQTKM